MAKQVSQQNAPVVPNSKFDGGLLGLLGRYLLCLLAFLLVVAIAGGVGYAAYTFLFPMFLEGVALTDLVSTLMASTDIMQWVVVCGTLFVMLLLVFFAIAWAVVIYLRWAVRKTLVNGKRLKFTAGAWNLFGNMLKWLFLSIITVGIYALWLPIKTMKWKVAHTVMEDPDPAKEDENFPFFPSDPFAQGGQNNVVYPPVYSYYGYPQNNQK